MTKTSVLDRLGRRLKFRDLQVFFAVVEAGSMARAAAELGLTQPAVSEIIAQLEQMFGVRLFDRSTRGVETTIYGHAFLNRARAAFDEIKQSAEEIEFLSDPAIGEVRIGTGEGMPPILISTVIDRLMRRHPRFTFQVIQAATNELQYRDLRARTVDLIFGRLTRPVTDKDLKVEILFNDPFVPVAAPASKWIRRRKVEMAELIDEPWCLFDSAAFRASIAKAFRTRGLEMPRFTVTTNSVQLAFALAASGRVLTLASASRLQFAGKGLGVVPIPGSLRLHSYPTGIVTVKNRSIGPAAQLFVDCARDVTRSFLRKHADHVST
jgi:DNA-binding transcriptional LysR family regulator